MRYLAVALFALGDTEKTGQAMENGLALKPEKRSATLAGPPSSIFRLQWTVYLIEAIDTINRSPLHDERIEGLLKEITRCFEMENSRREPYMRL